MNDEPKLPPGVTIAPDQSSAPISYQQPGDSSVQRPELEGIQCSVQHPVISGHLSTTELGLLGAGVVVQADGSAAVMVQMKHADGTSLGVLLGPGEYAAFAEVYLGMGRQANLIMVKPEGVS